MTTEDLIRKYTDHQSQFVEIDGGIVHYKDEGSGFPLVLVHGTFASLHAFDHWVSLMQDRFRIIRMDLPGLWSYWTY